jgi:hypothetical protein
MLRSRSLSSIDDLSSVGTGNSLQMAIEGQWDETVSIREIHDGVVKYLSDKLERLKRRYLVLKNSQDENRKSHLVKKIVTARIGYQRYLNVTRDILERCNDFMKHRRDTPSSRIAFMRNVQEYFVQARDFVRMDITLKKISPTLLNYVQPKTTDSPNTYRRKRDMCRVMSLVVNSDKNCVLNSTSGKTFRSRYAQQNKFLHTDFLDSWVQYLPLVLRNSLDGISDCDLRWLYTIVYLFSKHCTANYLQQGYCPSCMFPIVNERGRGLAGGKLYCPACKKEIEWTYYMNPRTICIMIMGFHPMEIDEVKDRLIDFIDKDPGVFVRDGELGEEQYYFEDILNEYLSNYPRYVDVSGRGAREEKSSETSFKSIDLELDQEEEQLPIDPVKSDPIPVSPNTVEGESSKGCKDQDVVLKAAEALVKKLYGEGETMDMKTAKETFQFYQQELLSFEGKLEPVVPRGLIPKIERYVCHYFKVPEKEEVRKLPLGDKGERQGTSRGMIIDALKELYLEKHMGIVSNIANKMWGSRLPNMTKHHVKILTDCVVQKEVFTRMSTHGRKSNLNQRLILMYITNRYGYKWDAVDFRVSTSTQTLQKQIEILDEIFKIIDPPAT